MPAFLALPVLKAFLGKWWPAIAAVVVIVGLISVIYLRGYSAGKTTEINGQLKRENETQVQVNDANENASVARVESATKLQQQAQELKDAEQTTDSLDAVRVKRGCVILRQQGRDTSKIPGCR